MTLADKAQGRIIWQYRNGAKFKAWVAILPVIGEADISQASDDVVNLINVDSATGEALNICGRIVGIPDRPSVASDDLEVFAYDGTPGAQPYGVAPYIGPGVQVATIPLPDYLYRLIIRAKIIKNTRPATVDDVKEGVEYILGGGITATVVDLQDMTMRVILSEQPSFNVRAILELFDVIPRPQGVLLEYASVGQLFSQSGELGGDALGAVALGGAE